MAWGWFDVIYPLALAIIAGVEGVLLTRRHLLPWLRQRRKLVEQCEVCSKWLRRRQVRELRADATDDADLDIGVGGTYMVATYCRRHFPR